jgi:hypothetical protein
MYNPVRGFLRGVRKFIDKIQMTLPNCADINLCLHQGLNFIAAIAAEGEQNAVDHCCNDGNFLPYRLTFILFTVHYYFDTCFLRGKTLKKYVDMFLACQQSKVTIKLIILQ